MKQYKKDQRGIAHNLLLAGIAVLVLGAISFAGFRVYKSKNDISAKAAGYPALVSINNGQTNIRACLIKGGKGAIQVVATNSSRSVVYANLGPHASQRLNPHQSVARNLIPGQQVSFTGSKIVVLSSSIKTTCN